MSQTGPDTKLLHRAHRGTHSRSLMSHITVPAPVRQMHNHRSPSNARSITRFVSASSSPPPPMISSLLLLSHGLPACGVYSSAIRCRRSRDDNDGLVSARG